jgi:hypothetical protein
MSSPESDLLPFVAPAECLGCGASKSVCVQHEWKGLTGRFWLCDHCHHRSSAEDPVRFTLPLVDHPAAGPHPATCDACGTTLAQFIRTARLGCPECYRVFNAVLGRILPQVQWRTQHHGKQPVLRAEHSSDRLRS